jgi:integrase
MTPAPIFQAQVQDYLEERRRLGFALAIPGTQLMAFARHLDQAGHCGPLTMAAILGWVQGWATRATPFTWARRLDVVRPFARHLARTIPGTAVPERGRFGPSHRRLTPHIYTDAELVGLLAAAGRLPPPGTLRPATYKTFFGLVAATGLRLSEALRLCCADVDLVGSVLTVRQTKFAKSRLVPLHPTTAAELTRYDELRRPHVPAAPGAAKGVPWRPARFMASSPGSVPSWGGSLGARTRRRESTTYGTPSSVAGSPSGRRTGPTSTMPCSPCPPMSATPR